MPIEINELVIRVAVNDGEAANANGAAPPDAGAASAGGGSRDAIVAECVEQVMRALKDKEDR